MATAALYGRILRRARDLEQESASRSGERTSSQDLEDALERYDQWYEMALDDAKHSLAAADRM